MPAHCAMHLFAEHSRFAIRVRRQRKLDRRRNRCLWRHPLFRGLAGGRDRIAPVPRLSRTIADTGLGGRGHRSDQRENHCRTEQRALFGRDAGHRSLRLSLSVGGDDDDRGRGPESEVRGGWGRDKTLTLVVGECRVTQPLAQLNDKQTTVGKYVRAGTSVCGASANAPQLSG